MKGKSALFISFLLLIVSLNGQSTLVTYYVQHEIEPIEDYIEIVLEIKSEDASLTTALTEADNTVSFITNLVEDYCKVNSEKKAECKEIVESGKFNVEPKYQVIRKEPVFIAFVVTYEVTAKILHVNKMGSLVDKINKKEGTMIKSLEWKAFSESDSELNAIIQGVEEGQSRCANLGLKFGQFNSVEEIANFQIEQEEAQQDEQQQQQDEEPTVIVYKFNVECVGTRKLKK